MQNLAEGLYTAEQLKETGWSKSEKMLLTAMLVYCSVEHDDFGHFQQVLETAPEEVIETVGEIPEAKLAVQSLKRVDNSDLDVIYTGAFLDREVHLADVATFLDEQLQAH